jgi:peroxiredoxin
VEEMKDEPFALIGVNSDSVETAKEAIEKNGLNWRSFQNSVEGESVISSDWCVAGWPTVVVLDADRKIRYRGHDGYKATDVAKELLAKLNGKSAE